EDVAGPAAKQQQTAERECIGVDNPLQAGTGEAQRVLDVGECDVHDRGVEYHHELGSGDHEEGQAQMLLASAISRSAGAPSPGRGLCGGHAISLREGVLNKRGGTECRARGYLEVRTEPPPKTQRSRPQKSALRGRRGACSPPPRGIPPQQRTAAGTWRGSGPASWRAVPGGEPGATACASAGHLRCAPLGRHPPGGGPAASPRGHPGPPPPPPAPTSPGCRRCW